MKTITLAASAINQTPLAWSANERNLRAAIHAARAAGAQLLCLPELSTTGYGCEDAFLAENTQLRAWQMLRALLPDTAGMVVSFGLPVLHQNTVFNAAALVVDQRIIALVCKRHLAGDGIHYEPRWFKPWPLLVRDVFLAPDNAEEIPLGDLLVDVGGIRIGFEICEDAWVAQRPGADLAALAVDVILNPSASHFAFGKRDLRRRFVQEGSRAFGATYVYSNLSGNEAGRAIYDGQTIIATGGAIVAEGPRFQPCPQLVTTATVDVSLTRLAQARTTSHRVTLPATHHPLVVRATFDWAAAPMRPGPPPLPAAWETSAFLKEEEFARAVAVALFDYLRKSGTRGFTVSLSGGADSAAVVCLVHLMVRLLLAGNPGWLRDCLPFLPHETDPLTLTGALLVSAYQATEHSGPVTRAAAATLANAIGARHHELDLTTIHHAYLNLIGQAIGRPLDWQRDDIPLQNIQARIRAPGVWMLANLTNSLLLTTSNRSEAAVGYATMDGDTAGSLAPIAGIDKAWLRHWLSWLETTGPQLSSGLCPLPALACINRQQPTAELRPAAAAQTDEDDLMPYPVLDAMERAAIRDKQSPADVMRAILQQFPHYPPPQVRAWIIRFFTLWSRNQWKRERYAPSFHLDDENLDPKTWCRWPILSGGFKEELEELSI
jgi:NAD+ synthase (glutamine-hydrolysing)